MPLDYRERKELRDYLEERRLERRLLVVRAAVVMAFALLLSFYWYLQVVEGEELARQAQETRLRREVVQPRRGRVLDREGRPLASNRPGFSIYWNREQVSEPRGTAGRLARLLGTGVEAVEARLEAASRRPAFQPVLISEGETLARAAAVDARRLELPGVEVEEEAIRHYDRGPVTGHVVGYLREVSEKEVETHPETLAPGDLIGKTGVERVFDERLRGEKGLYLWLVDSHGRRLAVDRHLEEPVAGEDVVLTLDLDLQTVLVEALGERSGAGVFLDARSGEILAAASSPAFDPNLFSGRFTSEEWRALSEDPDHPLQNRVLQGKYPPGSTFKMIVAAAALEAGHVDPARTVWCPGHATFYRRTFHCWKRGGHGHVNLYRAIRESCNVYFYTVGKAVGVDGMAEWANRFGLGQSTGADLGRDLAGTIPSTEWKLRSLGEPWYPGETISVAIGQGYLEVTPLQMARVAAAIGNGGRLVRPHIVPLPTDELESEPVGIHPASLELIRSAMEGVVNETGGTGGRARLAEVRVAGKTGTVQVVGQLEPGVRGPEDHSWFVGFAPAENARIAFAVIVEHGGHGGSTAAPVARAVLEEYYREREETPTLETVAHARIDR